MIHFLGSQERSANEGESGLGLYIVKSIMEGCGGSVEAKTSRFRRGQEADEKSQLTAIIRQLSQPRVIGI